MRSSVRVDRSTGAMQLRITLGEYRGRGEASLPVTANLTIKKTTGNATFLVLAILPM
jgi:hypothetical protein